MPVIKVQKILRKEVSIDDQIAEFCYYYPQYKFHEARNLPYKRLIHMLKIAQQIKAKNYHILTRIVAAPHTKKGEAVKKLLSQFEDIINA